MTPTIGTTERTREQLVDLAQQLGSPSRAQAIAAEGNVSARLDDTTMTVTATGAQLQHLQPDDLVDVHIDRLVHLLKQASSDEDVTEGLLAARTRATAPRPSVEAMLHAVCYSETDTRVVAHSHPTSTNALLCSNRADLLVTGDLFPDQIVVLGRHRLLVPYVDPGLQLARHLRRALRDLVADHGTRPRIVFAANHGVFALGSSAQEALLICDMAEKCSQVLLGALAAGEVRFLSRRESERIDERLDERERRATLSEAGSEPHLRAPSS